MDNFIKKSKNQNKFQKDKHLFLLDKSVLPLNIFIQKKLFTGIWNLKIFYWQRYKYILFRGLLRYVISDGRHSIKTSLEIHSVELLFIYLLSYWIKMYIMIRLIIGQLVFLLMKCWSAKFHSKLQLDKTLRRL